MQRLWLTIGLVLSASMVAIGCQEVEKPEIIRPVRVIKLEPVAGFRGGWLPGRAEATTELNLGFEVAGTILERPVNKGDNVKQGQLLARLDPRDFQNEIKAAVAQRNRDQAYRSRIAEALKSKAVARQDLDDADARLEQSRALVKIKRKALEDSKIYAPFDGSISWTYKEVGQRVQAKENVLRLLNISQIEFTVDVPETMITEVPNILDVIITFDAHPNRRIPARIKEIGTEASAATRTYPVTLIFDQPEDIDILPGMAGRVMEDEASVRETDGEPEFLLPLSAFFTTDGDNHKVWIVDEATMTISARAVTRGKLSDKGQYVRGLKEGMRVVTAGVSRLREGQQVTIAPPSRERKK